ncbi:MAG: single-stranded DNA-binding protein [Bacteroidales bacterium]|jgi:single-strand DNA-binding protein|nr:single-stranded DNA-binding protein [Bacteroidales bacterium]
MASLNKVILIGRLGKDPEITTFESGNRKMSVTLATTERYRDRDNNWVDQTEWHNLVAWGNLANDIADKRRNYAKGDMMYVEGRLRTRQYTDNQGINRFVTEIQVDKLMQLVSARPPQQSSYNPQQQNSYTTPQEPVYQAPAAATDPFAGQQMPNDDLPF